MNKPANYQSLAVVVPFYRGRRYARTISDEILANLAHIDEIIFLVTGPDDSTVSELSSHSLLESKKVTIHSHENMRGIGAAYNLGLSLSTSNFTVILDQDDSPSDAFFPTISSYLQELSSGSFLIGGWSTDGVVGKLARWVCLVLGTQVRELPADLPVLGWISTRSAIVYPTKVALEIGFIEEDRPGTDIVHLDQLRGRMKMFLVPNATVHYRIHSDSQTSRTLYTPGISPDKWVYRVEAIIRRSISRKVRA